MSSAEWASWVQAAAATTAVIAAIGIVRHQAGVERDNRIVDDAAFASYINSYLTKDIEKRIKSIGQSADFSTRSLVSVTEQAMRDYKSQVLDRLKKLSELPLTDWPDIEFANAFYDANLQIENSFAELCRSFNDARARVARKNEEVEEQTQAAAGWRVQQRTQDEEDAVAELGASEDGRTVILPPVGQIRTLANALANHSTSDDVHFETFNEIWERDREYTAHWERLWHRDEEHNATETFRTLVVDQLHEISLAWSTEDGLLRRAINRYVQRAVRFDLPTTYEDRAKRPKKLTSIFP